MHVEVPKKGALSSIKAFGGEYSMIVISILTALALEHGAQSWHHSHRAAEAQQRIEAELRANLDELHDSGRRNTREMERLERLRKVLVQDIRANVGKEEMAKHVQEATGGSFGLNYSAPTLRREAWDVAVASQAASWMPAESLQRYSAAYSMQRDTDASTSMTLQLMLDAPAMFNATADIELGQMDPMRIYHAATQMRGALSSTQGNLRELEKQLEKALQKS